jgi:hypothetical protein
MKDLDDDPNTDQFEVDPDLLDAEETAPPDGQDFLRTVEMASVNPMTRPMPSLDAVTKPRITPPEILKLARPTTEDDFVDSIDFRASMDADGAITVPESLRARVRGPVRVRIFFDKK